MKKFTSILSLLLVFVFISSTNVSASTIVVFNQNDSRWGTQTYGYSDSSGTTTIGKAGCGLLSLVNAVYYLNGTFIEPTTLATYSTNNGYHISDGTVHALYQSFCNSQGSKYGIKYVGCATSYASLTNYLQNGNVAIIYNATHLMACVDYDASNQTYLILDSAPSSTRGTASTGYAWKTQSQMSSLGIQSQFYIIGSTITNSDDSVNSGVSGSISISQPTVGAVYRVGNDIICKATVSVDTSDTSKYFTKFYIKKGTDVTANALNQSAEQKTGKNPTDTISTSEFSAGTYTICTVLYDKTKNEAICKEYCRIELADISLTKPSAGTSCTAGENIYCSAKVSISDTASYYTKFFLKKTASSDAINQDAKQVNGLYPTYDIDTSGLSSGSYLVYAVLCVDDKDVDIKDYHTITLSSPVSVTGVSLNKTSLTLTVGSSKTLYETITPSNATNQNVSWSSSNTSVATVSSSGKVLAKTKGTAVIKVTTEDGNKQASCTVTVTDENIAVTGVSLNKQSIPISAGDKYTLRATISPTDASNQTVSWTSSDKSVATVSSSGVVTAVAEGTATITVTTEDGGKTATCTVTVGAKEIDNADCGENLTWTLYENGLLKIEGTGDMDEFSSATAAPWYTYREEITSVSLPEGITSISEYAFYDCKNLTYISIPSSVKQIKRLSYGSGLSHIEVDPENPYYSSLDGVLFNKNQTEIIEYPPSNTSKKYSIPDSVTSIGCFAFERCSNLTDIYIPGSVTHIESYAFRKCQNLININIPNSVTSIDLQAFWRCENLKCIELPDTLNSINESTFGYCFNLTDITIPVSVKNIGKNAFDLCYSLQNIYYEGTETEWQNEITIEKGNSYLTDATIHYASIPVTGVSLNKTVATLTVGDTETLTAAVTPSNATNQAVTWQSSNPSVATVSSSGLVTAKTAGTTTITVTTVDGAKTATCTVTVSVASDPEPDPDAMTIEITSMTGRAGKTVQVPIVMKNTTGLIGLQCKVGFNSDIMTLTNVADGGILGINGSSPTYNQPYILSWENDVAKEDYVENGTLATMSFQIKDGVSEGIYPITLTLISAFDKDAETVEVQTVSGMLTIRNVLIGDVNGDGVVDAKDRMTLARYLAGWEGYEEKVDLSAADVNQDGEVTAKDRMYLARTLSGWDGYALP